MRRKPPRQQQPPPPPPPPPQPPPPPPPPPPPQQQQQQQQQLASHRQGRTWEEADRHCKQYNLRLGYTTLTDMKMIHDKFKQLMGRNEPDAIIWRAVMLPDENKEAFWWAIFARENSPTWNTAKDSAPLHNKETQLQPLIITQEAKYVEELSSLLLVRLSLPVILKNLPAHRRLKQGSEFGLPPPSDLALGKRGGQHRQLVDQNILLTAAVQNYCHQMYLSFKIAT
ncbi:unnamed protein product [Nippostrongylus brasiliensis]|uniref:C-type lectin domain-containing protein n=1 Tax=Nippostrongylus brasiliensis TaxID=27835 RepID=A0A0N4YP46_NIPBR|nr:unnamed protein product [Nippostrongylus brasiliensis]